MKKIIISILALVVGGVALTSCEDKLDIPQKAALTTETYYQTDNDAQAALASAYEAFQIQEGYPLGVSDYPQDNKWVVDNISIISS